MAGTMASSLVSDIHYVAGNEQDKRLESNRLDWIVSLSRQRG